MPPELSAFQRRNRAKLLPPAPKSERREYVTATIRPSNRPLRVHEDEKVIIRDDTSDFRDTELRSLDRSREGFALERELEQKLAHGVLSEREFEDIRARLADIRNDLMSIQADAQRLPEGRRRTALMRSTYDAIASIENAIHRGDLDIHRQETEKRRNAIKNRWSPSGH